MKINIIQAPLIWEDAHANRNYFENKIRLSVGADIHILPEMFTTGFTMNPSAVSEEMSGETIKWMQTLAASINCAITGSFVIKNNEKYYNRLVFVFPTGGINFYDKRHLFSLAGEDTCYTKGTSKQIVEYRSWKICLQICYDLRFPVFSRNTEDYDMLIYVANWPSVRIAAWDALLKARAIENMCYVIGVNRIGTDANGHSYPGHSQIVDALGNYVVSPTQDEGVFTGELDQTELTDIRNKLGFLRDRDDFTVN